MNWKDAKLFIVSHAEDYLQRDRSGRGFICPVCGSGSGKHGTGITTQDGIHFTCWRGCYVSKNIIDIIGMKYGLQSWKEKLEKASQEFGVTLEKTPSFTKKLENSNGKEENYENFFKECYAHREECEYLQSRGISVEVQNRFEIGYCENWQSPTALRKGYDPQPSPRVIIPTSSSSYVAVDVRAREGLTEHQKQFVKVKEGKAHIFALRCCESVTEPVFVVEGEIDALSIFEVGHYAIGLGSTSNYRKFIEELSKRKFNVPFLIAMDSDESGRQTAEKISKGLQELNFECYRVNINGEHKDANEFLMSDREEFKKAVEKALEIPKQSRETEKQKYVKDSSAMHYLGEFASGISRRANTPSISTGFEKLDAELDGGLYEGLYIIGAISSLGKTTYCLQMADQIAKLGKDVMIFSLEMAGSELVSKSLSRLTAELAWKKNLPLSMAKTARGITNAKLYDDYSEEELGLIVYSIAEYGEFAEHLFISEGVGDIGADNIREAVEKHIRLTDNLPVVLVDYIQILSPSNERGTDKQNTDKSVLELKRISRDYKLPVIGISSFNRENYKLEVSMQAFKESGAIEYSSDVLIGLQLYGVGNSGFNVDEARKKSPRQVELRILKNRNGKVGGKIRLDYYAPFNYFVEV